MSEIEKYAIVTGCAAGIGYEIAKTLNNNGIYVIGLDIEKTNSQFLSFLCDVSDEEQVVLVMKEVKKITSRVNYLVNAAGMLTIGKPLMIKDLSFKQWDAILKINLKSVAIMTKSIYPFMKGINDASIVNISSEQSLYPDTYFSPYAVSKAAINMFTICAAKEFIRDNIRVNAIALGTVKTNILNNLLCTTEQKEEMYKNKGKKIPLGLIELKSVFDVVYFLLSSKSKYITGEILRCDGGFFIGNDK